VSLPFNIVHVSLSMETGGGGIENIIIQLVKDINHNLFKSTVGCLDYGGGLLDQIHQSGFDSFVTGRRPGLDWRLILRLARIFSGKNAQIVHTHNQAAHFYAGIAAKLARVPVVITTEHSRHNTENRSLRQLEKRLLYKITDKWIVVSDELADKSIQDDGLSIEKLTVVKNGVSLDKFRPSSISDVEKNNSLKRDFGICSDSKIIIMVARLHPIKNHELFLNAFSKILEREENIHALLVGDGECYKELLRQSELLSINNNVHFLGYREDVASLLMLSDIFVLCSKTEGLPVSLLEASAAHVPVLVTENSNKSGLIINKKNGIVVKDSVDDVCKGIRDILINYNQSKIMAANFAKQIATEYSLREMINNYEKIYIKILTEKGLYDEKSVGNN